mmetsp:Transcript_25747/g.56775  ORF Transcript_25747/g.56775 Transcript_25747/m.56775 type:complete len:245 (-) Transcript_25747:12-746(-)
MGTRGGQAKIGNAQPTISHDHHIVGLQITVNHTTAMYKKHSLAHVCEVQSRSFFAIPPKSGVRSLQRRGAERHHNYNLFRTGEEMSNTKNSRMSAELHHLNLTDNFPQRHLTCLELDLDLQRLALLTNLPTAYCIPLDTRLIQGTSQISEPEVKLIQRVLDPLILPNLHKLGSVSFTAIVLTANHMHPTKRPPPDLTANHVQIVPRPFVCLQCTRVRLEHGRLCTAHALADNDKDRCTEKIGVP